MSWTEIEDYKQLEQDYERALTEFRDTENSYLRAAAFDKTSPELEAKYEELVQGRQHLEEMYARLRQIRNNLAHMRESTPQKVFS